MRPLQEILDDIREQKLECKLVKQQFGKHSVEYAEEKEVLDILKDERDFTALHE